MKLLFVHDHPFYDRNQKVYSGGGLPSDTWPKYLKNFTTLTVFGRKSFELKDQKVLSSHEHTSFYLTENYSSLTSLVLNYQNLEKELLIVIDNVDVVLIRLPSVLGIIAARIANNQKKKIWIEVVGNAREAFSTHGSIFGKIFAPIFDILNKKAVKEANFVSYVTQSKLQLDYPSNTNAITASISNVIINNIIPYTEIEAERFTSKNLKICLIGGFDAKYKGQEFLLRAVKLLPPSQQLNIELYLIGKGDFKWVVDLAKKLNIHTNIKFIGSLESGKPILNILKEMSLYIQPSLTEGMPRALLEAMSMGCPVMGSRVGGIPDVVSEDLLHKKGDIKNIANQIEMLISNRQRLLDESLRSLKIIKPYLKTNLDIKREEFYTSMNKALKNG
ncbi:glycosyltransferase [Arenibacter certesii]|uniref:Glycosyl transferase family 1 domain-containing protein n=1 Tax=Arenibacter certesii TaxID=228955 RepID=A0A918MGA0_9FLAO|nr:glycosyltransferase [Arenibacter certesii]GGW22067.1 hypothetical protein GCM10007383_01390 [Arenibacter certesii]